MEAPEGVEQTEAGGDRVIQVSGRGETAEPFRDFREGGGNDWCSGPHQPSQLGTGAASGVFAEYLGPGPEEGSAFALVASAPKDFGASFPGTVHQLFGGPGLPDTRLSRQHEHAALAVHGTCQGGLKALHFPLPTHESGLEFPGRSRRLSGGRRGSGGHPLLSGLFATHFSWWGRRLRSPLPQCQKYRARPLAAQSPVARL